MELKNLLSKKTQQAFSTAGQGIQKKFKPVIDVAQEAGTAIKQEFSPMVENVSNAATNIAKPIVEPIQQAQQRTQAIGEINTFFSDAGITLDDIKALAEDEGIDPNEVITKFQKNGIKVQGMEELQAQEQAKAEEEANKPFQFDVAPEYDEVTALSKLTGAIPKFQDQPNDSPLTSIAKSVGNLPTNALQVAGGIGDIGLSYARNLDQGPIDAFTETAKAKIINPTIAQAYDVKNIAQEGYQKGGVLGATEGLVSKAKGFAVENPVSTMMMTQGVKNVKRGGEALKTAGQEAMQGNIGKATAGLAKSTGIGLKENIYDPIKMGVTAPIKLAQLGAKGVGVVAKKAGIKAPERVQNISNNMAERMLSSQWKLTKPIRKELEGKIGQSGPKFALENDLVGKDIESTADNAGVFKIDKIKEKIEAVKTFGKTETPSVAKNVAQVLKSDIEASVEKSYGKGKTQRILDENHPELAGVYRLADEITKSNEIDYVKLEQLKELHDYLNPENIQYDISGKPISETRNILSAGKRQKLQQILEAEGQKRGIDIKKINKDIQGAYTLEKGLNDTVGRIANLNILGLGDTQTAVISSILGGAPGAVGGILLKKGLTSEGFVGGLAKSIYSKKNASTNNSNPSGDMTPPVTRLGRIMNNSSDTTAPKVEPKGVTPKPKTEGVTPKVVKPSPKTLVKPNPPTNEQQVSKPISGDTIPDGYTKNMFGEIIKKPSNSKGGFIRIPFTSKSPKPQPKRLFAGENSAQPPKGKTGWFKGADGKMRFEIDDSGAQVLKSEIKQSEMPAFSQYKTKLKDVLGHSELFKQYPELKEMDVYFDGDLRNNGFYSDGRGLGKKGITLKADFVQGKEIPGSKGWKNEEGTYKLHSEAKSTILHELQHAIQEKEGFAKGGNLSTVSGLGKSEQDQIARVEKEIRDAITKKNSGDWVFESSTLDEIINSGNAPSEIKQWAKSVAKSGEKGINEFLDSTPFAQYQKLAGEVEARNVQSRMGLSAKERTIKKPESTEDVPRAKQIIRMDSKGPSMSIKSSPKPIVKNLQKTEKSATIGDMETKKLIEEARKYKSGRDMYNTLDYDNRSKFDKIGVYSLKHFEDFYKKNITNTKGEIVMYRGQSKPGKQVQFNDTKFQGNTDGGVFFTTNKDIARKYGENIIELKSNKNNTLSYKEAEKLQKMAEKIVEKDIRNGIQSKPIIEQMALGRPKAFAEYTKKPFLETGDMFGEQGEMIYYKGFDNK